MRHRGGRIVGVLAAALFVSAAGFAQDKSLGDLLKATGLKYSALEGQEDSWRVPFDAQGGKTLDTFVTYNDASTTLGYSIDYQVQSGQDVDGPFTGPSTFTNFDKEAKEWQTFFGPVP